MAESKSSRAFLVAALVLGVLATAVTFAYLQGMQKEDRTVKVRIAFAKRDLPAGATLDPDKDLVAVEVPDTPAFASMLAAAVKSEATEAKKGQRLVRRVPARTPMYVTDLGSYADLEWKPGTATGLSIPVKGAAALSGLLVPGDKVKILVTRPSVSFRPTTEPSAATSSPLRWETVDVVDVPVKVLAVGTRVTRLRQEITALEAYQAARENENLQTVTVEVSEAQAKQILEQTGAFQLPVTLLLHTPASTAAQ